jgi:hypothetical protein
MSEPKKRKENKMKKKPKKKKPSKKPSKEIAMWIRKTRRARTDRKVIGSPSGPFIRTAPQILITGMK